MSNQQLNSSFHRVVGRNKRLSFELLGVEVVSSDKDPPTEHNNQIFIHLLQQSKQEAKERGRNASFSPMYRYWDSVSQMTCSINGGNLSLLKKLNKKLLPFHGPGGSEGGRKKRTRTGKVLSQSGEIPQSRPHPKTSKQGQQQ